MDHEELTAYLRELRERWAGVTDSAVAAVDGLLIAADTQESLDAEKLAALAAAELGLARRVTTATDRGALRRAICHGSQGPVAIYAVGDTAVLVVLGDEGLDLVRLHQESKAIVDRVDALLTDKA
ncbi:roadblock/LC7 domain-containing protein [Streptomyces sp. NPDC059009]|uniref:roadblock/LC7 domain-containing protein n=1 Tax=Streptomyces sp. NPDC059009 TaxID=3346694 RepID=UPI003679BD95